MALRPSNSTVALPASENGSSTQVLFWRGHNSVPFNFRAAASMRFARPSARETRRSADSGAFNVLAGLTGRSTRTLPLRGTVLDNRLANFSLFNAPLRQRPVNSSR